MKKRLNLCLVVALLIVMCLSMSACANSNNQGKQNPTSQTEDKKVPTLEEVLKEQEDDEEETDDIEEYQDSEYEDVHVENQGEGNATDESYEEEF